MLVPRTVLYFCSFTFSPVVYVASKQYKRGLIMNVIGVVSMMIAVWIFNKAFQVGNETMSLIILGSMMTFVFYGILVWDCIRLVRRKEMQK